MEKSIRSLVLEFFQQHPKQDFSPDMVVDWVTEQNPGDTGSLSRDTWRSIRQLQQEELLIKVKKGVYRYDPEKAEDVELCEFPPDVKEAIFKRDNYQCVFCGLGRKDGVKIYADHITPKDKGGDNSVDNGQTLCAKHNLIKKNHSQTEAGKMYFIKMYEKAVAINDLRMVNFCKCIFDCYDQHKINGHSERLNGHH